MKKLVFLRENPDAFGGAEIYLKWIKNSFNELGINGQVRGFDGKKNLASWIKALLFNKQARKQKSDDELYFSLARVDSSDIYHTDDGVHKIFRKTKKFWFLNPLNFVHPYLERKCFNNAKCIIAISQMVKKQIIDCYKIDESKIKVVYNGVEFPKKIDKNSAKKTLCDKLGLDDKIPLILFVGNGFKRKGVEEILKALNMVKKPYNAVFVGKDKKLEFYKKEAEILGVNAIFTGAIKNANEFFEASDIFILLAHYEPFGIVALEAMGYANAVILSKDCGASELIDSDFVANNEKDASRILEFLLNDMQNAAQIGLKNRKISSKFSLKNSAEEIFKIVKSYL